MNFGTVSDRVAGSMLNAMQFFPSWENYFNKPSSDTLGRLSAMYSIGSIASLVFVPILSDRFGRRCPIIVGCMIMILAAAVQVSLARHLGLEDRSLQFVS